MVKQAYIRFMAPVIPQTTDKLLTILDTKIREGYNKIHLLISSPGGSVFHGLSLYNFMKGSPIEIDTYNFGSVDSIGVILFCAGTKRFCVPHARFLIHGVRMNFAGQISMGEKELEEKVKSLKIDQSNIAKVIADTTGKEVKTVENDINNRITLNPEEAMEYKLVQEIKTHLFPANAELHIIGELQGIPQPQQFMPMPTPMMIPRNENFTSLFDIGFTYTCSYV